MHRAEIVYGLRNLSGQSQGKSQLLQRAIQGTARSALPHRCHLGLSPMPFHVSQCCPSPSLNCSLKFPWSCHCNICQPGCECPHLLSPLFNLYIPSVSSPLYSSLEHLFRPQNVFGSAVCLPNLPSISSHIL